VNVFQKDKYVAKIVDAQIVSMLKDRKRQERWLKRRY
jgi:hypothetical protein